MRANDVRSTDALRHGAYLCLTGGKGAGAAVAALAVRLGLENEFHADGHPPEAIAFLRRVSGV